MATAENIESPNFTLILRSYDGRITGSVVSDDRRTGQWNENERKLVGGEIGLAQPLLSIFALERNDERESGGVA